MSGLQPCDFETVRLETYIGAVKGVDDVILRHDLKDFDCRNNRLAQMALEVEADAFNEAARTAIARYGRQRVGVFLGTSTAGILQTELAYRRRDPLTGALPADFIYRSTHNLGKPIEASLRRASCTRSAGTRMAPPPSEYL